MKSSEFNFVLSSSPKTAEEAERLSVSTIDTLNVTRNFSCYFNVLFNTWNASIEIILDICRISEASQNTRV